LPAEASAELARGVGQPSKNTGGRRDQRRQVMDVMQI
jgi:hypothetical protein